MAPKSLFLSHCFPQCLSQTLQLEVLTTPASSFDVPHIPPDSVPQTCRLLSDSRPLLVSPSFLNVLRSPTHP
jgi:hypothetical protein